MEMFIVEVKELKYSSGTNSQQLALGPFVAVEEHPNSPGANSSYLECKTNIGCVAFWGTKPSRMDNIELIASRRNAGGFTVEYDKTWPPNAKYPHHDVWILETANVRLMPLMPTGPTGKYAAAREEWDNFGNLK